MATLQPALAAAGARPRRGIACATTLRSNPYLTLLYSHLAARGLEAVYEPRITLGFLLRRRREVAFLHYHFPDGLHRVAAGPEALRPLLSWSKLGLTAMRLLAARLLGYRVVWTVHQVLPHDTRTPRRDTLVALLLARVAHVLIAHDETTRDAAREILGRKSVRRLAVVPHGSYVGVYPAGRPRDDVRRELGIAPETFVFLCFGMIRPYKGVETLLEAFAALQRDDLALVIAGKPSDAAIAERVGEAARRDHRVVPQLGLVPAERVGELFGACDAAVLARADGGTSGSLVLSLSLGLPVVAADTPTYRELTAAFEAGWPFAPGDPDSLRAALARAADDRADAGRRGRVATGLAAELRWDEIADRTAELLLARRR